MNSTTHTVPLFTLAFARAYAITMRPYLLFVSGITGILGIAAAQEISPVPLVLIALSGFLAYGFGQALTDCTQTDTDSISAPYRPLVQGMISKTQVLLVSLIGLTAVGTIYLWREPRTIYFTLAGTLGLASYTWFKRRWWGGPAWNAIIVVDLAVISYFAANASLVISPVSTGLLLSLATVFFGYANFVLSGYYKDVEADRATGYRTLPVVYGYRLSNFVSDLFAAISIIATLFGILLVSPLLLPLSIPSIIAFLFGAYSSAQAQIRLHRVSHDDEAHLAIKPVVNTYILQLTAIILALHPGWWFVLLLYYGAYTITMKFRPLNAQI